MKLVDPAVVTYTYINRHATNKRALKEKQSQIFLTSCSKQKDGRFPSLSTSAHLIAETTTQLPHFVSSFYVVNSLAYCLMLGQYITENLPVQYTYLQYTLL